MRSRTDLVRGWFLKAESDVAAARRVLGGEGPYDAACFHAQQAAEKYLKGLLAFFGDPIPRTHNMEELQRLCAARSPGLGLEFLEDEIVEMTSYGVELRYDFDFWPDQETAQKALDLALAVRDAVLAVVPTEAHPQNPEH